MADHANPLRLQHGAPRKRYQRIDAALLQQLSEIASDITIDGGKNGKLWQQARTVLEKIAPGDARCANIISIRTVSGLARLVSDLKDDLQLSPAPDPVETAQQPADNAPAPARAQDHSAAEPHAAQHEITAEAVTAEVLKRAMKAFRKRLKLTRLDDESRLGNRAMTGGRTSEISAIMAPREFGAHVWEELAKQGKLRSAGGSFYELGEHA